MVSSRTSIGDSDILRGGQSAYDWQSVRSRHDPYDGDRLGARAANRGLDGTPIEDVIQNDAAINTGNSGRAVARQWRRREKRSAA